MTISLNPDNVQEYKVTTNNATPEEGRNSGASVSIATRSGGNQFHGTAFEFLRNTALNANAWFANALGNPKPDMELNQYGFEMSGPIRRNKTFFFGSWQGITLNTAQPINQVFGGVPIVYTAEALAGKYRYERRSHREQHSCVASRVERHRAARRVAQGGLRRHRTGSVRGQ